MVRVSDLRIHSEIFDKSQLATRLATQSLKSGIVSIAQSIQPALALQQSLAQITRSFNLADQITSIHTSMAQSLAQRANLALRQPFENLATLGSPFPGLRDIIALPWLELERQASFTFLKTLAPTLAAFKSMVDSHALSDLLQHIYSSPLCLRWDYEAVLEEIHTHYALRYDALRRHAIRFISSPDEAPDAVQQAFLQAFISLKRSTWQRLHQLRGNTWPWLKEIVKNVALTMNRKRAPLVSYDPAWMSEYSGYRFDQPEACAIRHELIQTAQRAFQALPPLQRNVLERYYQDGSVTTRDIANSLGRPKGTVDGNLKRGRDRMGKTLIKLCFEADDLEESYLGWPHYVDRSRNFSQTGSEQTEEDASS